MEMTLFSWVIVAGLVIGLVIGFIFNRYGDSSANPATFGFFGMMFGCVPALFFYGIVNYMLPLEMQKVGEYELVALQDGNTTSGSFFLGTGTISGVMTYHMAYKWGNGFRTFSLPANNVVVYYDDNPRIVQWVRKPSPGVWWEYLSPVYIQTAHTIHVPSGSIKNEFNVDLR
jgi:hypothetical protein